MQLDRHSLAVKAEGLSVGYKSLSGKAVAVLRDFDLEVPEGDVLTIIGPSGCGKSTFLRAVADLLPPLLHARELSWLADPARATSGREEGVPDSLP